MATPIENYREMVEQPWGKIFYDIIYHQLTFPKDRRLKILDFGAGFCITAMHYAKNHDVTAVEPNEEMYKLRFKSDDYALVTQGIDYLKTLMPSFVITSLNIQTIKMKYYRSSREF